MNTNKKILTTLTIITTIVLLTSNISAYKLLCLNYGQSVPSEENKIYTCWHDTCQICVSDNNNPGVNPAHCKDATACEPLGSGGGLDITPPVLTINSPTDNQIFNSRKVLFNLTTDEPSSLYYLDNINGRGRWKRMGIRITNYLKSLSFKDGLNDITIKATDKNGNPTEITRQFYVDSKKPKIKKTYPGKNEFTSGLFQVQFDETNPKALILYYGNSKTIPLNIETDCEIIKNKYYCSKQVNLEQYNNKQIEYYFELTDIADNTVQSKPILINVDTQNPRVLNKDSFWTQGEGKNSKYIYFNIEIDESNLDEVTYFYEDSRGKLKEKKLCSKLKEKMCTKKIRMQIDEALLNIQIIDEAGNVNIEEIGFLMDS